jgi:hypothetical protein
LRGYVEHQFTANGPRDGLGIRFVCLTPGLALSTRAAKVIWILFSDPHVSGTLKSFAWAGFNWHSAIFAAMGTGLIMRERPDGISVLHGAVEWFATVCVSEMKANRSLQQRSLLCSACRVSPRRGV